MTAYEMRISDGSSDVCSSDLLLGEEHGVALWQDHHARAQLHALRERGDAGERRDRLGERGSVIRIELEVAALVQLVGVLRHVVNGDRSEERSGGTACVSTCRSRWSR